MNLEKAYCIKLSSLVGRLFLQFWGKKGAGENSFFYTSYEFQAIPIGKIDEAEKTISSQACKEKIQATIHTIGTKWIANKDGEKSFLSTTEPFIEFLDRVIERGYNYIKEVRRKGR